LGELILTVTLELSGMVWHTSVFFVSVNILVGMLWRGPILFLPTG